jgi:aminoglycoside phosphotransferase (APT) family kinase protein
MYSRSKTEVGIEAARAMVARCLGDGRAVAGLTPLTGGFFNAAYRIDLADGPPCVLKVAPPPGVPVMRYERGIMRAEAAAMGLARERTAMPVPRVLAYDDSRAVVPSDYYLMEFVPGRPLDQLRGEMPEGEQDGLDRRVGELLAELNAVRGEAFGYLAAPAAPGSGWREVFCGMLAGVLADGEAIGAGLPLPYPQIRKLIAANARALDAVAEPRLVHWDLWDGNIFVDPGTYELTGIIDFERALWGDPLMEFQFRTLEPRPAFAAGYGPDGLGAPEGRARRHLYNLYLYAIMIIECDYRQYPARDQAAWAAAQLAPSLAALAQAEGQEG